MALLDTSRTDRQPAVFADFVSRTTYRIVSALIAWNDSRRTRDSLNALTAAELDDIGLTRSDIDAIVKANRF